MRIQVGSQDTRKNEEDLALTPYLFIVNCNEKIVKVFGLGFCWFYFSIYIAIGFNIPKDFPFFIKH